MLKAEEIIRTNEFSDFYQEALAFCEFLEQEPVESANDFLKQNQKKLLNLYDKALKIQWVDLQSNIINDNILDNKELKSVINSITIRLDDKRYYWHVFDPTNQDDKEPVCGDLVDDLRDIYKDLKFSITTFNRDEENCKASALWQFKFDFESHWGDHCINALSAIHFFIKDL